MRATELLLEDILERLENVDFEADFYMQDLYQITDDLKKLEQPEAAVEAVFRFIENHPDDDLGSPGPLVHFVEQVPSPGYEEKLVASLRRRPTPHSVWMLNRVLNGLQPDRRPPYADLMKELSQSSDEGVAVEARGFLATLSWEQT